MIYDVFFLIILCFESLMIIGLQIHYSVDVLVSIIYSFLFLTSSLFQGSVGWYREKMDHWSKSICCPEQGEQGSRGCAKKETKKCTNTKSTEIEIP
jgi:hypothetical protein